ncbi:MAG: AzlC family ABC transporter permease [Aestuariivirga sp.]
MSSVSEFRQGVRDILPVMFAAVPIALLWGTLAVAKGLTPVEASLMSFAVFAGASQFVAIDQWKEPAPWLALTVTVFVVNIRHVLMSASLSRHMQHMPKRLRAPLFFFLADENWALAERRAVKQPLTLAYYLGLGLPLHVCWTAFTAVGAFAGRALGDPAAYGFDFAFSAIFIAILVGFWKGPRTGVVLAVSAAVAALVKLTVPGAWFIVAGGLSGALIAALLHREGEA